MELTLGLHAVVFIIGLSLTAIVSTLVAWYDDWDWLSAVPPLIIGFVVTLIGGTIGVGEYESTAAKKELQKIEQAEQAELTVMNDSLPEPWQLVFGFLDRETNQATRNLIIHRFTTEGYGALPAPDITFEQHRYFTSKIECRYMGSEECRKWKNWVAQRTEPFVKFNLLAVVAPPLPVMLASNDPIYECVLPGCVAPIVMGGIHAHKYEINMQERLDKLSEAPKAEGKAEAQVEAYRVKQIAAIKAEAVSALRQESELRDNES